MIKISEKEAVKKRIIYELLESKKPVTIAYLASLINKTGRTVQNYLDEIEVELSEHGIKLIRKANFGVCLEMDNVKLDKYKAYLHNDNVLGNFHDKYSSNYRRQYILKILLEEKIPYTIQFFSDNLYCSKTAIVNDLSYLQTWLEKRGLILKRKQNQGLWAEGSEKDFRNALKDFLYESKEKEFEDNNLFEDIDNIDYRIDFVNYKKLKSMFPKLDIYEIQLIIKQAEDKMHIHFIDQAFLNLITHIAIAIERVKDKKSINMNDDFMDELFNKKEYDVAAWVVSQLSEYFKVDFSKDETGYIAIHFLGAKAEENFMNENHSAIIQNADDESVEIAREIINTSSEILNIDFTKDENLLTALVLHLRPTIARLKYGLKLYNPLLERIKKEYTSIFGAAWVCSSIFEKKLGVSINEDEVSYITLHLAVAASKLKKKISTIVCCSSGIGTSQMVAEKIKHSFEELEIVKVVPYSYLKKEDIEKADLIITTVRYLKIIPNSIYVSSLLDDEDLKNIAASIKNISRKKYLNKTVQHEKSNSNNNIFENELIFLDDNSRNFIEAIKRYGALLQQKGYAKEGFSKNVIDREKKGTTFLGKGIAIPHARDEYVNTSKICFVKLKNPIMWNGNQLEILIILCLKFDDIKSTKEFFKELYNVIRNDEILEKIKNEKDPDKIIKLLNEGGSNNGTINN